MRGRGAAKDVTEAGVACGQDRITSNKAQVGLCEAQSNVQYACKTTSLTGQFAGKDDRTVQVIDTNT